jgi:hypothetical protein
MHTPIQKIRNDRCRKTSRGLPMAKRDKALGVSDIKVSAVTLEHIVDGLPVDVRHRQFQNQYQ